MNADRLLTLATYLETVPREQFDLEEWSCGTAFCAVGHACMIPEFNDLGLTLRINEGTENDYPEYRNKTSWDAVRIFFDLDKRAADYLFSPDAYTGTGVKRQVINRIRKFVEAESWQTKTLNSMRP